MKLEEKVGELLKEKKLFLSTAESCTGGGIAVFDNFYSWQFGIL